MKVLCILLLSLVSALAESAEWTIYWEAAKGELTSKIPYDPKPLQDYLFALPSGHFEANEDIKSGLTPSKSTVELIGKFKGRKIVSVEHEIEDTYYSRYFIILAEVELGKFMPIYVHQYSPVAHGHSKPVFVSKEKAFSISIDSLVHGTTPSHTTCRVTSNLKSPPRTEQVSVGNL